MRVTFVTGVSCAGKTTLGNHLADHHSGEVSIFDLDEDAPARPNTAWLDWLRWRAAENLHMATEWAKVPDHVSHLVVTGITWPVRLIESPAWAPARKAGVTVRFALLDPPWKVLRDRLDERTKDKPKTEQRELRRYNRHLRLTLRDQVYAVRNGQSYSTTDLAELAGSVMEARW